MKSIMTGNHLSEMLLQARLHGARDGFRTRRGFSPEIEAAHAILFNSKFSKKAKIKEYRKWLESYQPCVFGKIAAKNKQAYVCLLEEDEILRMRRGDQDLRDTIQDHRQVWKRYALEGFSSSFLVLLVSKTLPLLEPGEELKEICRRLMQLYMEVEVPDDTIIPQREYVFLRQHVDGKARLLQFSTLPNIFCSQGDGRWWGDHRTPGGIMITSNALGHFMYVRTAKTTLDDAAKGWAAENAMRTIGNAHREKRLKHTPATFLVPATPGEKCPFKGSSEYAKYSAQSYSGYFHTDHLIPSVFFQRSIDPVVPQHDGLDLQYIYESQSDPESHAELMTGKPASWYEIRRNMDRLPDFANPEKPHASLTKVFGRLGDWLDERLRSRF